MLDGLAGTAGVLGVTAVPFGVVVAPLEVAPGVIVLPLALAPDVPVVSVFEDCGTPTELAGTQSARAEVEVLGLELALALGEVEEVVELLLGDAALVELDDVLAVELGEALVELLGIVLLVEVLGVEVVLLIDPVALALVLGTIPAGQLLVEDALGVVEGVAVVLTPVCDEVVDEGDVVVVVVDDVVCAATHVVPAVRITTNASFFMFSVLVKSSGSPMRCPDSGQGALPLGQKMRVKKDGPASAGPRG